MLYHSLSTHQSCYTHELFLCTLRHQYWFIQYSKWYYEGVLGTFSAENSILLLGPQTQGGPAEAVGGAGGHLAPHLLRPPVDGQLSKPSNIKRSNVFSYKGSSQLDVDGVLKWGLHNQISSIPGK